MHDVLPQFVLRHHASDGLMEDVLGAPLKHVLDGGGLHVADVARVIPVNFRVLLPASHELLGSVDHHAVVTMLTCIFGDIIGLVFTAEEVSCHARDAAERHPLRIEQVPGLALVLDGHVGALRLLARLLANQGAIQPLVVHAVVEAVPDVRVEGDTSKFFLRLKCGGKSVHALPFLFDRVDRVVAGLAGEGGEFQALLCLRAQLTIFRLLSQLISAEVPTLQEEK
eukprot:CAMPEP_0170454264 /NCGR_PEP_ID=MMETSP0123-20130129/2580_1 /TAXON_ID=182087 /ORGANISM="Favella ehrenbergii, Strain Fehren 1" /LENGTH=224 /DNA_ID=CAMNT_0010716931 /DNA_START=344 /DNA_END=1015 /DNA_ORIENTATION=-